MERNNLWLFPLVDRSKFDPGFFFRDCGIRMTLPGLEKPSRENPNPFANQSAPIKVLPFHGILCIHYVDLCSFSQLLLPERLLFAQRLRHRRT